MHLRRYYNFGHDGYNAINMQIEIKLEKKPSCTVASMAQTPLPLHVVTRYPWIY